MIQLIGSASQWQLWGMLGQVQLDQPGQYFSIAKILVVAALIWPWLRMAPWVQKDAKRVRTWTTIWPSLILAAGAIGLLIWLLVPMFILGLLVYVVLTAGAYTAYVLYRNQRVEPEARVLTADHLSKLLIPHKKVKGPPVVTRVKMYDSIGKIVPAPSAESTDAVELNGYRVAQDLLHDMIWRRASEADLTASAGQGRVRFVIDGVVSERSPLPPEDGIVLIEYLKRVGGMNAEERRRPQQGKIAVDLAGQQIDVNLTAAGTTNGQRMAFRVLQEVVRTNLNDLGMSANVLKRVREIAASGQGIILVSARAGNGVTSTLYSVLRDQDPFIKQLVSMESKVEVDLENITQTAYGETTALPPALASALRRDPDVVMVDRCEEPKCAQLIVDGAASKLMLVGFNASDSFSALGKWIRATGDAKLAVSRLSAVLCQVLLRRLCPTCKKEYRPDPALLAKANLPAGKINTFYQPPTGPLLDEKGNPYTCPTCQGSGYLGRMAAFELLEVTDEVRQLAESNASLAQIKAVCRKNRMLYLQEAALAKVIEGQTSMQEVIRVTQSQAKAAAPKES